MQSSRYVLSVFLLLFVVMTAAAEDNIQLRGCRRGVQVDAVTRGHRAGQLAQAGGDFYRGDRHQLVVLAAFRDRTFQDDEATTLSKWDRIFNAEDYHEDSFVGSVHDYFYDQSYGQFNLMFDLVYVNLPDSAKKYRSTEYHDEYSQYLVDDIVDNLQTLDIDWSQYDWNGDGYVNQIVIVYAGKGQNAGGSTNTIWPHQWWLSQHLKNPDNENEGFRSYRTVTSGNRQFAIDCYCCVQEIVSTYNTKTSFGTICHEYSHCFGFPDFYYDGGTMTVGEWDLMDYGNYNNQGYCPTGYSAHERWLMGWLTPIELTSATTVSNMPALCDEAQAYIVCNSAHRDEYYMIENRQQKGWDRYLRGNGLVVFHVDYDATIWPSTQEAPNSNNKKRYSIIPANNRTSASYSSGWPYPYQSNDSLTNTSKPAAKLNNANTDGSLLMNVWLYDIKTEGGLASFRFDVDAPTAIHEQQVEGQPQVLCRLGSVVVLRYPDGQVRKVVAPCPLGGAVTAW